MFAVGWFVMPVQATTMTIVQQATSDGTRGRVAGALNAAIQTASIGSMAAAGILADVIGMRAVFALGGAVAFSAASSRRSCSGVRRSRLRGGRRRPSLRRGIARGRLSEPDTEGRRPRGRRPSRVLVRSGRRQTAGRCACYQPARQSPTVVDSFPITDR